MSDLRTLTVVVIEAKDVIACDKGKSSDPYCKLDLVDGKTAKAISGEGFKTKTKKKTLAPVWNETFEFGKKGANLDTKSQPTLVLNMFDSDTFSSEDMGRVTIPLGTIDQSGGTVERWFKLENTDKADNITGEIKLSLTYSAGLLTAMPIDMSAPPMNVTDGDPAGKLNELHILLVRATGIKVMDKNMLSKGGSSDPMMTFHLGGDEKLKSSVKKKSLAPVWEETFKFPVSSSEAVLTCIMDDYDMGSGNDFMGQFSIPLEMLTDRAEKRQWYELEEIDGNTEHDIGSVLLAVKWIHNPELISIVDKPVDYNDPPWDDIKDGDLEKDPNELNIFILKAHNLKIMDKNLLSKGGSTDPMFTMVLGEEKQKTKVIKKNLNPEYFEKFTFGMRSNSGKLKIICDDYDMGSGNDFVGMVEVDLSKVGDRKELRSWYQLGDDDGSIGMDIGHVLVAVRWIFNPERLSPVDQPIDWENPKMEVNDEPDEIPNELNIMLIRAYGLPIMDKNMFSKGGSSDPVVSFKLGSEVIKSTVKKKNLNPEWGESFQLPVKSSEAFLEVLVDDYDMASGNDLIGTFKISLAELTDRAEHRAWHPLGNDPDEVEGAEDRGWEVTADIGHVLLAVKWVHNPERLSPVDIPVDYSNPVFPDIGFVDDVERPPNELVLFLVKAWGLKVMDKNMFSKGGSSDPLVQFTVGDTKVKSTVKKKNLNPEWNETFRFPVKNDKAVVKCLVQDYDMASGNDDMGVFEIPLAGLENREELRIWYHLAFDEDGDGTIDAGADIGSCLIGVKWVHNPDLVSPVDQPIDWEDPPMEVVHVENDKGFPPNQLGVTLIRAYGVKVMDKNMFSKGGSSDPVVTFSLKEAGKISEKKSTVVKKNLNPVWKEHFAWQMEDEKRFTETLVVSMDDYDMASGNDFIGSFEVPLNELSDCVERRSWFTLIGEEEHAEVGSVLLAYKYVHNPEYAPFVEEESEPEPEIPVELTPFEKRMQKCVEGGDGTSLNLSKLQLDAVPEAVNALTSLTAINFRGNLLSVIRDDLFTFTASVSSLNLSMNAFSVVPSSIPQLSYLMRLVLNDNQLSTLPIDLFAMPKLAELYVERNYLRDLPKGISVALNMTKLMLAGNQLTYIPEEVAEMPSLKMFDVRDNPINEGEMNVGVRKIYDSTVLHVSKSSRRGLVSRALTVRKLVEENRERQLRLFAEQEKAAKKQEKAEMLAASKKKR
ncbi:hypothetical protein TrST_g7550 [Triparma strigata]|uniref:C2 domain-containing protein n=1 Tax=Triparma strigata TaxID=1606541 RepID=A0A9W7E3A1_9STRA|nr:hypothetical protein TrST_g7550 [Triparma strigata]